MRRDGVSIQVLGRGYNTRNGEKIHTRQFAPFQVGRWVATKSDRYLRFGFIAWTARSGRVRARGSKEAQFASAYVASLSRWARTEKPYELAPFHGKKVGTFELVTASRTLKALADAGLLQIDSLYAALKDTV